MEHEIKRSSGLLTTGGIILLFVCFWDIFGLKVSGWTYYYPFKVMTIGSIFLFAYLIHRRKLSPSNGIDFSGYVLIFYSWVGVVYLHSTYIFSFFEIMFCIGIAYTASPRRFFFFLFVSVTLACAGIHHMPEPSFLRDGETLKPHFYILTVVFASITYMIYWFYNKQRKKLDDMTQRFALIGRQSSFLLHELKAPLSRFLATSSKSDDRSADHIFSIIHSIEMLVTTSDNFQASFMAFSWEDFEQYLKDEFAKTCGLLGIKLTVEGFDGEGKGNRETLKLAIRNLVKNAIESIPHDVQGEIKITKRSERIEVSNNGTPIKVTEIERMFTPLYSTKKNPSNYGIGLHFVESVIKAHGGSISVFHVDGWSTFRLNFQEGS